ncbi:unnamed protein product [Symbiodinium necroappetens]|uniref:Uncharacterized protein n=1 Tax=Symbiodinium necroappetens TaxID=1628268 RepID=A0A812SUH6_9DINO|nr:unnamed protein product [Symbiodinium necroappetens]
MGEDAAAAPALKISAERQLSLLGSSVPLWHVEGAQLQWSIPYVLEIIHEDSRRKGDENTPAASPANRRKNLKQAFYSRSQQVQVQEWHSKIWPGVPLPRPLPYKVRTGQLGCLPERTAHTSVLIASLGWMIYDPAKRASTVRNAASVLTGLVTMLCRMEQQTLVLWDMQRLTPVHCMLNRDGTFNGDLLWGADCARKRLFLDMWHRQLASLSGAEPQGLGVKTMPHTPHVADVIVFAFSRTWYDGDDPDDVHEDVKDDQGLRLCTGVEQMRHMPRRHMPWHVFWDALEKLRSGKEVFISGAVKEWKISSCEFAMRVTYLARMRAEFQNHSMITDTDVAVKRARDQALSADHSLAQAAAALEEIEEKCYQCIRDNHAWVERAVTQQFEEGSTGPLFAIWALRLERSRIPFAILENTPDFHVNIVHDMLSHLYHIYELMVDLADVGHSGAARKRVYVILVTKQYRIIADPRHIYKEVATSIRQRFTTRPRDYLTASALEIRPLSLRTETQRMRRLRDVEWQPELDNLSYLLSPREREVMTRLDQTYERFYGVPPSMQPDLVYFLGDSAERQNWSAKSGKLPTFRRNAVTGKYWYPAARRWLTNPEKMLGGTPEHLFYLLALDARFQPPKP